MRRCFFPFGTRGGVRPCVTLGWRSERRCCGAVSYWSERATRAIVLGAAVWIAVVTLVWLFAPVGESTSVSQTSTGQITTTTSHDSLLDTNGTGVVVVLAVPVALIAIAVAAQGSSWRRRARCIAGGMLLVGSLLGAMSVGLPYLPAAVAVLVAGLRTPPRAVSARSSG